MSNSQQDAVALALCFTICSLIGGPLVFSCRYICRQLLNCFGRVARIFENETIQVLLDEADSHMKQPNVFRILRSILRAVRFLFLFPIVVLVWFS
jgi:hypothetical protein